MGHFRNLAALAAFFVYGPVWAATPAATAAISAVQACAKVTDDKERLACFDRQVPLLDSGSAQTAAAGSPPAPAARKLTPEQKIGLPREKVDRLEAAPGTAPEPVLENFTAKIRSVSPGTAQRQVFVLDNDQVWRQVEAKTDFSVHPGDTVSISRGALGSFFMSANVHSATRVSRVR